MFNVEPSSGAVLVSGPLDFDYVAIVNFQVQANNTLASYQVQKTDTSKSSPLMCLCAQPVAESCRKLSRVRISRVKPSNCFEIIITVITVNLYSAFFL